MEEKEPKNPEEANAKNAGETGEPLLAGLRNDPIVRFVLTRKQYFISGILLSAILLFAFFCRMNTFWLPHWMGDQCHYVSLAMKLDLFGFDHYSLRGVDVGFVDFDKEQRVRLVYPRPAKDITSKGQVLGGMEMAGITYYDQPFFHKPPAFPYALMLSHRWLAANKNIYTVVFTNIGEFLRKIRPRVFFEGQFYAAVVPLFFSLGLVLCAFFMGRLLFSDRVGLYAAFLMAIHPVSIMTAQKLWTDDMVAFFVSLSIIMCILSVKYRNDWLMLPSGISCGISILAKQTGGCLAVGILLFSIMTYVKHLSHLRSLKGLVFNKGIFLFLAGVLLVSGFWFLKIYNMFGHPFYLPAQQNLLTKDLTGWFKELVTRPKGPILYLVGIPYLCPLFLFSLLSIRKFVLECWNIISRKAYDHRFILLWIIVLVFYYYLKNNREHRLMLPVYPVLGVLAGYSIDRFREYLGRLKGYLGNKWVGELIILALFLLCAMYSVPIGIKTGLDQMILLRIPF